MALPLIQLGLIAAAFVAGSAVMRQGQQKQQAVNTAGTQIGNRISSSERRLQSRIKSIEDDVKDRESANKLRDLELAAQQKFPTTQEEEDEDKEDETEEGMTGGLSESDRILLEDLIAAQQPVEPPEDDDDDDMSAENQRQTARELIEYEQYLLDKNERLRRLEALQMAQQGTPVQSPTNPFEQCWPCPPNQVCPQVCYPISGAPPPWYGSATPGGTPAPGGTPIPTPPQGPTCPPGYTYEEEFDVCVSEAGEVSEPTPPPPTPTPTTPTPSPTIPASQLPPTSQVGGANPTRCSNVYNGSCGTECSSGNTQLCADCNAVCGTSLGSSSGGGVTRDESRCQSEFNGSCGTECEGGNASDCNTCRIVCGEGSSYARRRAYEAWTDNTIMGAFTPPTDNAAMRLMYYTRGRY